MKYLIPIDMSKNTDIYTTCWVYVQAHSLEKYAKINTSKKSFFQKVSFEQASWTFHCISPILKKKRK